MKFSHFARFVTFRLSKSFVLCILLGLTRSVHAIPPPETFVMMGTSIIYPGLFIVGLLGIFFKYISYKFKIHFLYHRYSYRVILTLLLLFLGIIFPSPFKSNNEYPSVSHEDIERWLHEKIKIVLVDIRSNMLYQSTHLLGTISTPEGKRLDKLLMDNPDKIFVIICDFSVSSSNISKIGVSKALVGKAVKEHRLYYYQGGYRKMMKEGGFLDLPILVQLPSGYSTHLLKTQNFVSLNFSKDAVPKFLSTFEKAIKSNHVPIIHSQVKKKKVADILGKFKPAYLYFTSPEPNKYGFISSLILPFTIFGIIVFVIRRNDLYRRIRAPSKSRFTWILFFISFLATIVISSRSPFESLIPFDVYLYIIQLQLPMNPAYLIASYLLFGLLFLCHLMYPTKVRMQLLQQKLQESFVPGKYSYWLRWPKLKDILLIGVLVCLMYLMRCSLSVILTVCTFLLIPLLAELMLFVLINRPLSALKVLMKAKFCCNPEGDLYCKLSTCHEYSIGSIELISQEKVIKIGLFSGHSYGEELDEVYKEKYAEYSVLMQTMLLFFKQDLELDLDENDHIICIKLYQNHTSGRVLNRHQLLLQHQTSPQNISEPRFSSLTFQEIFRDPMPLTLDILQQRWDDQQGCQKALRKLGLLQKYNQKSKSQFCVYSYQIYLDAAIEKTLFSFDKWYHWLRRKIVQCHIKISLDDILNTYHFLIYPRMASRNESLSKILNLPMSSQRLKRHICSAINSLCKESAMWQIYCALLHEHSFSRLQLAAREFSIDLSSLMSDPGLQVSSMPSYYELSAKFHRPLIDNSNHFNALQKAFFNTEFVRKEIRNFQLKEWQLIGLLIDKLTQQRSASIPLTYLLIEDFRRLPRKQNKLMDLLKYRFDIWQARNQWSFPECFSLQDCEKPFIKPELNATDWQPIRVAGNQQMVLGRAMIFQQDLLLEKLPKNSILIADNLLPEQLIACLHIQGVILKKGSYLSHTSILARERNIPMVARFQTSDIQNEDRILIRNDHEVSILRNTDLEWFFLDEIKSNQDLGHKANHLVCLEKYGFHLPKTILLTHATVLKIVQLGLLDNEEINLLYHVLSQDGKVPLIVRSSTNVEDSEEHSHAGLFYSKPNILTQKEMVTAIIYAFQYMTNHAQRIERYSGKAHLALNLILQQYIKGSFGGVLFTKSKFPGQMHLEIAKKGAVGVTEGSLLCASLIIDENGIFEHLSGEKNCLTQKQYCALFQMGRQIEAIFGKPQDIEWIMSENHVYILQTRDIITYKEASTVGKKFQKLLSD